MLTGWKETRLSFALGKAGNHWNIEGTMYGVVWQWNMLRPSLIIRNRIYSNSE